MNENKSSLSSLVGPFKEAARDVREGANVLTTHDASYKFQNRFHSLVGHGLVLLALERSVTYASRAISNNPDASPTLFFAAMNILTAAIFYYSSSSQARANKEHDIEATFKNVRNESGISAISKPEIS